MCLAHAVLYFLCVYDAYFKPLLDLWFLLLLGLPYSRGDKDDVFVLLCICAVLKRHSALLGHGHTIWQSYQKREKPGAQGG